MTHFTPADADRILGLADQFLEEWHDAARKNRDKEDLADCFERAAELKSVRPLLVQAPALLELLDEAESKWGLKLRYDVPINHAELTDWMSNWLRRVRVTIAKLPVSSPARLVVPEGPS